MGERSIRTRLGDWIAGKSTVVLSIVPETFQKIPGATDILEEVFSASLNKYQLFDKMVKRDPELNSAVNKIAMLVKRAYKGIIIHPEKEFTEEEKSFLKTALVAAKKMKFSTLFFTIARRLCIDGDVLMKRQENGEYIRYDFLPMSKMTAFGPGQSPTNVVNNAISGPPSIYYYDEEHSSVAGSIIGTGGFKTYNAEEIVHVPLGNLAEEVYDIEKRWTWGIWSHSPLESLRPTVYWRLSSMVNDMIWRRLYLPREHHEIDLTDILDPSRYEGETVDARMNAAKSAAEAKIKEYITKLRTQLPDQGYVTPKVGEISAVKITIIEPKSTTYVSPNELLKQLATSIYNSYYTKASGERSASFAAEYIVSSDEAVAAEHIAEIIKEYLLEELQRHFDNSEDALKLDIRLQLIQPKDVETLVRMSAVLRSSATVTIDEIRVNYLGLDPLTEEQRAELATEMAMMRAGANVQTMEQLVADFIRRSPSEGDRQETDRSRLANQLT